METGNSKYVKEFLELYNIAIDNNGNPRSCGRETCKRLIETANKIRLNEDYGNINTGMMNVNSINELYNVILNDKA